MDVKTLIIAGFAFLASLNPFPDKTFITPIIPAQKPSPSISPDVITPPLSLETIFSPDHSWVENLPQEEIITLITTGDVIPARSVNWKMTKYNDFTYPFQKTADFLKSTDLTLINLESPLTNPCPVTQEGMVFCGSQRFIEGLKFADIDIVNLANNHSANWGTKGLCQTIDLLNSNGILQSGLSNNFSCPTPQVPQTPQTPQYYSNLVIKEIKNLKIGFLGYNILDKLDQAKILEEILKAKSQTNFLIVSFHWGAEYTHFPAQETIDLARKSIDAGADLIVGNHPHWYQPIEIYKEKPIIYAHGNYIFDQEWSKETKKGFLAKLSIYQKKVLDLQIIPIFIHDYSQAYFLVDKEKEKVLKEIKDISYKHRSSQAGQLQQKTPEN